MPKRTDISSILVIGAGPIIIGQACEFDYSGTQAIKALKEEGYRVILVNSNPATIMTDPQFADIPAGAVDAIVLHPLTKGQPPDSRKPVFSSGMMQLRGSWLEREWPVIIGAYRAGETADAIALDQVMLRHGESGFLRRAGVQ